MSTSPYDYPLELAGCHGRIDAYRAALDQANRALLSATPYVYNVASDPTNAGWRSETAAQVMETIRDARDRAEAELGVTNA